MDEIKGQHEIEEELELQAVSTVRLEDVRRRPPASRPATPTAPGLSPEMMEFLWLMSVQQERVITATQASMGELLRELKRGRADQIEIDQEECNKYEANEAERLKAKLDLEERNIALREEELRTARQEAER